MENQNLILCLFKNGELVNQNQGNTVTLVTKDNIKAGEYKVAFSDGKVLSDFTDVPAIDIVKIGKPTNIKVTANTRSAKVTAE